MQFLELFTKLIALKFCRKYIKGPRVHKIVKKNQVLGGLGQFRSKNVFPETIIHKYF